MSFLTDETGADTSKPRDLYFIRLSTGVVYYLTSASRDIPYDGHVYKATPMLRGTIGITTAGQDKSLELTLPINHPIVKRWTKNGVPPRTIDVTVSTMQAGGDVEEIFEGPITAMRWEGVSASFRIPSRLGEAMQVPLPTISDGRGCPYVLYGAACAVSRDGSSPDAIPFKCTATAISVNGNVVKLDLSNVPAAHAKRSDWLVGGDLTHTASGESMAIMQQVDSTPGTGTVTTVTMQYPIDELKIGDAIVVHAGCAHDPGDCADKFDNISKHGGHPYRPEYNPFTPGWPAK